VVHFCTSDGFITEIVVPKVFVNLVIFLGMSVSCVKDEEYSR